uniref:Uncharacterized protein n=1 Tax=Panagrolaimus superbus TaxID=310955 RepID=A0A914Z5L4_9BILA
MKNWSREFIDGMIKTAKRNPADVPRYYEGESLAVHAATKHYNIKGQIGAVIGSHNPWAEAFVLANGAKHVTNIEYQKTFIDHPQMDFLYALDLPSLREK